jgi:hypothetical protein
MIPMYPTLAKSRCRAIAALIVVNTIRTDNEDNLKSEVFHA